MVLAYCCHDSTVYYTGLYRSPDSVPVYQPQLESVTSMYRYYTAVLGWYGILIPALFEFQLRNRSRIWNPVWFSVYTFQPLPIRVWYKITTDTGGIILQYFYHIYTELSEDGVTDNRANGSMDLLLPDRVKYTDWITAPLGNLSPGLRGSIFKLSL